MTRKRNSREDSLTRSTITRRQFLRRLGLGASAIAAGPIIAACAPAAPAPPAGGPTATPMSAAPAGPAQGGTMVWMGHQEVAGLSPDDRGPDVHAVMIQNIHNPVVRYNTFNELELILAEDWEVSDDGLTYTFNLRQGVLFHDGKELTSADVKYTWDYYRDPANAATYVGDFTGVDSIETPDDYTVVVNMSEINAASLATWVAFPIVQSEYHAEVGEEEYRTAPIGTGAFKLKEWRAAQFTEIEAFDDHFRGRPSIDVVRLDVVPEPSVRTIALQTGEADSSVWPLLVEDSIMFEEDPGFTVYRMLGNSIKHFPLNNSLPQLSDKRVRQAMMYAIDRQRIIDDLWEGAATVAHSHIPPSSDFHNSDLKRYDFNPEQARSLLDEAGWTLGDDGVRERDGVKLSFTCTTITGDQARRPIAELTQQFLKEVGIDMQLAEAPVASILEGMRNGTMDCSLYNWTYNEGPVEPNPFTTLHSEGGNNFNQFFNEEMDALIEEGLQIVDPEERRQIYNQIQEIFIEEVPCLYLQFDQWMTVFNNRIQGLPEDPKVSPEHYYRAHEWSLEDA